VARLAIVTVGMTHSGKSTFAALLKSQLLNSVVIDQDEHATFLNIHYGDLVPASGPNLIKQAVSNAILGYAIAHSDAHLILCNANRSRAGRRKLLARLQDAGFTSILVFFDLSEGVLRARASNSTRNRAVLRTASDFGEVLTRQVAEGNVEDMATPDESEANFFLHLTDPDGATVMLQRIIAIEQCLRES
jgi:predicted kinase